MWRTMSGARVFMAIMGILIAVVGSFLAAYVDKYLGIGAILVGGFLLTLTVTKFTELD